MEILKTMLFGGAVACVMLATVDYATALPDVHVSHSTGECQGVTTYQGLMFDSLGYSCENMPEKYNHVWVK